MLVIKPLLLGPLDDENSRDDDVEEDIMDDDERNRHNATP